MRFLTSTFLPLPATPFLMALPFIALSTPTRADTPGTGAQDPTRIVIEAEDMKGVDQTKFGAGPRWQVGRWSYDLYQNMIFGACGRLASQRDGRREQH